MVHSFLKFFGLEPEAFSLSPFGTNVIFLTEVNVHFSVVCFTVYGAVLMFLKVVHNIVDFELFFLFWQTRESTQELLKPTDAINLEDGGSKVSGSVSALHKAGVELNNPELKENSQRPVWKAKQQLLGLLKVCYRS